MVGTKDWKYGHVFYHDGKSGKTYEWNDLKVYTNEDGISYSYMNGHPYEVLYLADKTRAFPMYEILIDREIVEA